MTNLLNHLNLQVCSVYGNRIIGRYNHKESHSALLISGLWQEMYCVFWYGKICMVNISMVVIILLFQGLKHSGVFCPVFHVYRIWSLLVINYTEPLQSSHEHLTHPYTTSGELQNLNVAEYIFSSYLRFFLITLEVGTFFVCSAPDMDEATSKFCDTNFQAGVLYNWK